MPNMPNMTNMTNVYDRIFDLDIVVDIVEDF